MPRVANSDAYGSEPGHDRFRSLTAIPDHPNYKPLDQNTASLDDSNNGYGLIGATAIIHIGIAIPDGHHKHLIYPGMTMLRGALVALIYHETLELRLSAVEDSTSPTLMSTDVDAVIIASQQFHEIRGSAAEVSQHVLARPSSESCSCGSFLSHSGWYAR